MNICLIGKYPPIQGGVSASTYWLAYGLAERGHQVYVVTNATEVEEPYRISLSKGDEEWYEPTFSSGGFVRVFTPESLSMSRMNHIPQANPFVSKLAGLATQTIRQYDCDLIFSYYYEPYAMAGYLASVWTGLPLVVKHAGSDLDRLMTVPDLGVAYKEMLRAADGVVTGRGLVSRFVGMGVKRERIVFDVPFRLPTHVFTPEASPLAVYDLVEEVARKTAQEPVHTFDPTKPTIGIYGKVGTFKGSYDLIHALAILKNEGLQFNFLAMTQGSQLEQFEQLVHDCGLQERTQLLPFQPHWRVPNFIRTCTAVCFLERDFPIAIHGPGVQLEILSCGTCLVLSQEIANKQKYRDELVNGENVLLVADPKDHEELAAQLRLVITGPEKAAEIGAQGRHLVSGIEGLSAYIDGYETLLARFQRNGSGEGSTLEEGEENSVAARIEEVAPVTKLLLESQFESMVARFIEQEERGQATDDVLGLAFCDFVGTLLKELFPAEHADVISDILKYQRMQIANSFETQDRRIPAYGATNALGRLISWKAVEQLKPLQGNRVQVVEFEYDITPIFTDLDLETEEGALWKAISQVVERNTLVCFSQSPNLAHHEMKISPPIRELLGLCDGKHTTTSIVQQIALTHGVKTEKEVEALRKSVLGILEQLYAKKVIVFSK